MRFEIVHSNTKITKTRVRQSQVCYLCTTHSLPFKARICLLSDRSSLPWLVQLLTYSCQGSAISGKVKDGSLQINSLVSNNCFSYRHVFQNGVNALSKMTNHFCQKSQNTVSMFYRLTVLHSNMKYNLYWIVR